MWRWAIGCSVLGVLELLLVVQLHQWADVTELVLLYLLTTAIGFLFLSLLKNKLFRELNIGTSKKARKKIHQKIKNRSVLDGHEQQQYKAQLTLMYFMLAWVLIFVPGLITDLLGMLMVIPGLMNWIVDKSIIGYNQYAASHNPPS